MMEEQKTPQPEKAKEELMIGCELIADKYLLLSAAILHIGEGITAEDKWLFDLSLISHISPVNIGCGTSAGFTIFLVPTLLENKTIEVRLRSINSGHIPTSKRYAKQIQSEILKRFKEYHEKKQRGLENESSS